MRIPAIRLRWSDPAPEDPSVPVDWRCTSLILATLFLNFWFFIHYNNVLCCFGSLPVDAGVYMAGALIISSLFFAGPALAAQSAGRRIFELIEDSFGSIP